MNAMIDAQCKKCRKRFGWQGSMANMPACPRCGHRPPQEKLDADDAEIAAFRELLAKRAADSGGDELRRKRVAAGLNLEHVFRFAGITVRELCDIENGRRRPTAEEAAKLDALYSGETPAESK